MGKSVEPKIDVYKVIELLSRVLRLKERPLRIQYTTKTHYEGAVGEYDNSSVLLLNLKVKGTSKREQLVALCHELVHIDQINRGDLKGLTWLGEDQFNTRYRKRPHEVEAWNRQDKLADLVEQELK
jgi:hypothetical protein